MTVKNPTDTSEKGLETIIVESITGITDASSQPRPAVHYKPSIYGSLPYVEGKTKDYDRDHAVDLDKLLTFLKTTQPEIVEQLAISEPGPKRLQFLARLQGGAGSSMSCAPASATAPPK